MAAVGPGVAADSPVVVRIRRRKQRVHDEWFLAHLCRNLQRVSGDGTLNPSENEDPKMCEFFFSNFAQEHDTTDFSTLFRLINLMSMIVVPLIFLVTPLPKHGVRFVCAHRLCLR